MFHTVPHPSLAVHSLYTQQWYMSYRFKESRRAGPGWNCSSILVLLDSCLQNCMTYTIAECTVNELLVMDRELSETCRISCQNKFVKFVHLAGFIIKKFVTMHGQTNVKYYLEFSKYGQSENELETSVRVTDLGLANK